MRFDLSGGLEVNHTALRPLITSQSYELYIRRWRKETNLHSGLASSHFFLRRLHVPQPVLVRFANCWSG